jgi:hypothetical protein
VFVEYQESIALMDALLVTDVLRVPFNPHQHLLMPLHKIVHLGNPKYASHVIVAPVPVQMQRDVQFVTNVATMESREEVLFV